MKKVKMTWFEDGYGRGFYPVKSFKRTKQNSMEKILCDSLRREADLLAESILKEKK